MIPLSHIKVGTTGCISMLPEGVEGAKLVRLGLSEGANVLCLQRLPGGTLVLQHNRTEVAMSCDLARRIFLHD
ncbi:MAG: ferrous iron transport protein A [Chlorobi bacterium]|nr:ferrous iron transport protein A [Chlorobiota bacterium]